MIEICFHVFLSFMGFMISCLARQSKTNQSFILTVMVFWTAYKTPFRHHTEQRYTARNMISNMIVQKSIMAGFIFYGLFDRHLREIIYLWQIYDDYCVRSFGFYFYDNNICLASIISIIPGSQYILAISFVI